jgi:hypothetical protein
MARKNELSKNRLLESKILAVSPLKVIKSWFEYIVIRKKEFTTIFILNLIIVSHSNLTKNFSFWDLKYAITYNTLE